MNRPVLLIACTLFSVMTGCIAVPAPAYFYPPGVRNSLQYGSIYAPQEMPELYSGDPVKHKHRRERRKHRRDQHIAPGMLPYTGIECQTDFSPFAAESMGCGCDSGCGLCDSGSMMADMGCMSEFGGCSSCGIGMSEGISMHGGFSSGGCASGSCGGMAAEMPGGGMPMPVPMSQMEMPHGYPHPGGLNQGIMMPGQVHPGPGHPAQGHPGPLAPAHPSPGRGIQADQAPAGPESRSKEQHFHAPGQKNDPAGEVPMPDGPQSSVHHTGLAIPQPFMGSTATPSGTQSVNSYQPVRYQYQSVPVQVHHR